MPSYRCSQCAINYPTQGKCAGCGGMTSYILTAGPSEDWESRSNAIRAALETSDERGFAVLDPSLITLRAEGPWLWAERRELIAAGMPIGWLEVDRVFELAGVLFELQGQDRPRRRWWVMRLDGLDG